MICEFLLAIIGLHRHRFSLRRRLVNGCMFMICYSLFESVHDRVVWFKLVTSARAVTGSSLQGCNFALICSSRVTVTLAVCSLIKCSHRRQSAFGIVIYLILRASSMCMLAICLGSESAEWGKKEWGNFIIDTTNFEYTIRVKCIIQITGFCIIG